MVKILILTSGNVSKLEAFKTFEGVTIGSFRDINYTSNDLNLKFQNNNLSEYGLIYFRMVGKSLETATLVTDYAISHNIKVIDEMYTKSNLLPVSLGKSLEMKKLAEAGIKIPKTVFGNLPADRQFLSFPYIVKSTTGQKSREVWLVNNIEEKEILFAKLDKHKIYFAQELIPNARRIRALVVGDKVIGAIERQTKWNRDNTKNTLNPIPEDIQKIAVDSAKAVGLNIAGIDIIVNSITNEKFVIEANAAPAWKLINKYCGIKVEDEIIKFIQTKI